MHASLPMYDLPAVREATDDWWAGLARHLRAAGVAGVPERLRRGEPVEWKDPDLLISQTCGYPLMRYLAGRVKLLGTPCHDAPGCEGFRYSSALVVSERSAAANLHDLRGRVCAINQRDSHSGCNVLRRMVAPLAGGQPFFSRVVETGSHAASIRAVGEGRADLCTVDAVLHGLLGRHDAGALAGTRVLGFSPAAPGLPYVAGPSVDDDRQARLLEGIRAAFDDGRLADVRGQLLLAGFASTTWKSYEEITAMEREAIDAGYPELV